MDDRTTFVIFEVAGELCGLPAAAVREIVHIPFLSKPPGLPASVEGVLNLAGAAVPILRIERLYGLSPAPLHNYTPIIILKADYGNYGFTVDNVVAVTTSAESQTIPVPDTHTFNDAVIALLNSEDGIVHLLSPEKVLSTYERDRLNTFQEMAQSRLDGLEASSL